MPVSLQTVSLPDFGMPDSQPVVSTPTYTARLTALRERMKARQLDFVVVYGDREHSANTVYLTGYDPRFEESILVVGDAGDPFLFVGNEGWGYAELAGLPVRRVLYQSLSLLGQDRSKSPSLTQLLLDAGITAKSKVGVAGWKYFSKLEFADPEFVFEVPHYLVETLRKIANNVSNVGDLFMNPIDGLRIFNEAEQLAAFEFASCYSSTGLKKVLFEMKPGMTELEACALMGMNGIPDSAHPMLSSGSRAAYGLPSPSDHKLSIGEPFTMALGYWGALNARAGWLARDAQDLPYPVRDYVDKLAIPYFKAIVRWYETISIGVTGGMLHQVIHEEIGDPFFGVGLNPGHYIHLDEWVSSPVYKNSDITLRSGMAIQVDVIPATGGPYHTINIEDGIALADESLRNELAAKFPGMWKRIQARRKFMQDVIGIRLKPEVLPFSNIPAYLPPFMLEPTQVLTVSA